MSASEQQAARLLGRGRGTKSTGRIGMASERQAAQLLGRDGAPDGAEEKSAAAGRTVGSRGVDGADKRAKRRLRSASEVQAARLRRRG